jgi:hypothetical protein
MKKEVTISKLVNESIYDEWMNERVNEVMDEALNKWRLNVESNAYLMLERPAPLGALNVYEFIIFCIIYK